MGFSEFIVHLSVLFSFYFDQINLVSVLLYFSLLLVIVVKLLYVVLSFSVYSPSTSCAVFCLSLSVLSLPSAQDRVKVIGSGLSFQHSLSNYLYTSPLITPHWFPPIISPLLHIVHSVFSLASCVVLPAVKLFLNLIILLLIIIYLLPLYYTFSEMLNPVTSITLFNF